jgi:hypothetical protein
VTTSIVPIPDAEVADLTATRDRRPSGTAPVQLRDPDGRVLVPQERPPAAR